MRRVLFAALLFPSVALSQTSSGLQYGQTLSAEQWNALFSGKTDYPLKSYTVSTLPTCGAASKGALLFVTDATSPTYNATLTGSGAIVVPAFCNGSAWTAH